MKLSPWDAGKNVFGRFESGNCNLSSNRKSSLRRKLSRLFEGENRNSYFPIEHLEECILQHDLLQKYHLKRIGIFGSILFSSYPNDIDILVDDFDNYEDLIGFKEELEFLTGKKVDIVIEKYASPIIVYRAQKDIRYIVA